MNEHNDSASTTWLEAQLREQLTVDEEPPRAVADGARALHSLINLDAHVAALDTIASAPRAADLEVGSFTWEELVVTIEIQRGLQSSTITGAADGPLGSIIARYPDDTSHEIDVVGNTFDFRPRSFPLRLELGAGRITEWFGS